MASTLIKIQLKTGLLQIGPPSAFDPFIVRNARANVRPLLADIFADRSTIASLRAEWPSIMPGRTEMRDNAALMGQFRDLAESGRIVLVFVPTTRRDAPSVQLSDDDSRLLHLVLPNITILIAPGSTMPGEYRLNLDSARAADAIAQLNGNTDAALTLERYVDRLGLRFVTLTGPALRTQIATSLRQGNLQGAVLADPPKRAKAAGRKDAPVAVSALDTNDKIFAAMRMSRAIVRNDVAAALEQLLTAENAAKFVALTAAFIALQYVPVVNILVNLYVLHELITMFGSKAIDFAKAAGAGAELASKASTERALRAAAAKFAEAFEAFGAAGLAIVLARLQVRQSASAAKQTRDVLVSARSGAPSSSTTSGMKGSTKGPASSSKRLEPKKNIPPEPLPTLAGSTPARVLNGSNGKTAVIGRSMGDGTGPGVRSYAKELAKQKGPIELFDGPNISSKAMREWEALTEGGKRLSDAEVMKTQLYKENVAWAQKLKNEGYTVIDLGAPKGATSSPFYEIEKKVIFGD